jgi:tetratricopeptide (TPR) repeat protein
MIAFLVHLAAAGLAPGAGAAPPDPCAGQRYCTQATAGQLFAAADQLAAQGDLAGAAQLLEALTQDPHPELRAEARFRLAAVRERMGDLKGAAQALRDLLAEQPSANPARLELARILAKMGEAKAAKDQIAEAQVWGLPEGVQQNVRRFASTLSTNRRRGLTIEATAGPDSNINRSTANQFIDTIIAPFELDPNARRQAGIGYTLSAQGYSRDSLGGIDLLSRGGVRADLSDVARFNDVQLSLDSGPQFDIGHMRARPSALYERRWFGGALYSTGVGGNLNLTAPLSTRTQLEFNAARVRQTIEVNAAQDGWRTSASGDIYEALSKQTTARLTVRYGRLDARVRPESLRQLGGGLLLARDTPAATLFGEADYTRTHGIAPQFLFGKTRRDRRWDLIGGVIFKSTKFGGFSPLVRVTHTDSRANIVLYDYRRTRLDFGFTRTF